MATNKVYYIPGTSKTFKNTGGDYVLDMKNVSTNTGRVSGQWDRGTGALPALYKWELINKFGSSVTIGNSCRLFMYAYENGSTLADIAADTDLTAETQLYNFKQIGQLIASSNTVGPFNASDVVAIYGRYVNFGWWNASGQTSDNVDGTSYLVLTPVPDEIQAAS